MGKIIVIFLITILFSSTVSSPLIFTDFAFGATTIVVGAFPFQVVVDPTTNRVYSVDNGDSTVSVIDGTPGSPTENTVIATIPVGAVPVAIAVDPINKSFSWLEWFD